MQEPIGAEGPPTPGEPGFVKGARAIGRVLAVIEQVIVGIALAGLIVFAAYKTLKLHWRPPAEGWVVSVIRHLVFVVGLGGTAMATQSEQLFNIDMFTRILGTRGKLVVRILSALFTIFVCYMLFRAGMVARSVTESASHEGFISPKTGALVMPIPFVLIGVHMLLHVIVDFYYLVSGRKPPTHMVVHGQAIDTADALPAYEGAICPSCRWRGAEARAVRGIDWVTFSPPVVAAIGWYFLGAPVGVVFFLMFAMLAAVRYGTGQPVCPSCGSPDVLVGDNAQSRKLAQEPVGARP